MPIIGRNTVLSVMADNGKISEEQATVESQTDITHYLNDTYTGSESGYRYPYYFDAVIDEAVSEYGLDEADVS